MIKRLLHILTVSVLLASLASCAKPAPEAPAGPRAEVLLKRFTGIEKLAVAGMSIKKSASVDDLHLSESKGAQQVVGAIVDALKIGDRKAVYSYDTYLNAYIDLSELKEEDITIDAGAGKIEVRLPAIRTEFAGREAGFHEDHYRVTGLRSAIGPGERAQLKEKMNTLLKEEVRNNPEFRKIVTDTGRKRAESFFKEMLGYDGYEVEVSWK